MARGKKKEILTPEERLQAALVPESEQPYKVPGNWCWTYLTKGAAECLDSFRKPINASERANREGDIPYYGATGQVGWIDNFLTNEQLVLVGEDGAPFLDLIKDKAYIIEGKAWVNNHAHILRSRFGTVGNLFLMHYLNVFNYNDFVNGTTRLKLTQGSMDTMPVPIPPLTEQQRIVNRIESLFAKLDESKQKAQDALDSFETRKAAILHKAFTGELTAQWRKERDVGMESWETHELVECFEIVSGIQKTPARSPKDNPVPYLAVANVYRDKIDLSDIRYFEVTPEELEKLKLQDKDILIVEGNGSGNEIGRCAMWHNELPLCIHQNHIIRMRNKTADVLPEYVLYYLNSQAGKSVMQERAKTTAGLFNLSAGKVKTIPLPFASLDEQIEIVRILDDLLVKEQQAKEAAEGVLEQIDLIKKAILARAFRGELGTNDPSEESAVELLSSKI